MFKKTKIQLIFRTLLVSVVFLGLVSGFLPSFVSAQSCPDKTTVTGTTVNFVGELTDMGGDGVTSVWFEYGQTISYGQKTNEVVLSQPGFYCINISGLLPSTTYHYRAAARNSADTAYGENKTFTTTSGPSVDLKANGLNGPISVGHNSSVSLGWTSHGVNSCTASGAWSGTKPVSGAESTGALTSSRTYTLTCTGPGGTVSDSVTVNVGTQASPTVDIKANGSDGPIVVAYNSSASLSWASYNVDSCTASGAWSGTKPVSGSQSTGALTSSRTYTLTCTGLGGTISDSVAISVDAQESGDFAIKKTARNLSQGTVFADLVYANPGEALVFGIVVKADNNISDVIVKDTLPTGLIYRGDLRVDNILVSGDIFTGLNIGSLLAGQQKTITFRADVAGAESFAFGQTELINTALVSSHQVSRQDTAKVLVSKAAVAGAATVVPTGLTNNLFLDSFFLPLLVTIFIVWLFKSRIIKLEEWLDLRKKEYHKYKTRKTLQVRIAKIKAKEFLKQRI